jgi:capsular exopolysaccharide synthesis family protein
LLPTIGGLAGYFYSNSQDAVYQATASILVQQRGSGFSLVPSDFGASNRLASIYRRQATAKPFLDRLAAREDIPFSAGALRSMVSANTSANPPILEIKVRHHTPDVAALIAQTGAEELIDYAIEQRLTEIARVQSAAAAQGITNTQDLVASQLSAVDSLSLLEPVVPPGSPVVPRTRNNVLLGAILGFLVAAVGALALESLQDNVRSIEQLNSTFGISGLGVIRRWSSEETAEGQVILQAASTSYHAEAFRQMRVNLQFAIAGESDNVLLVTSPQPGEGKSTIVANLAAALGQSGEKVAVIDADLRMPSMHTFFANNERVPGLSNALADREIAPESIIHATDVYGVDLVPSGPTPPNPGELLGSPAMSLLLNRLKKEYDFVLIDSPPLHAAADASILASQSDGIIIVVDSSSTKSSSLKAALDMLRATQVNVLGAVVNKLKVPRFGFGDGDFYYYRSYYYRPYGEDGLAVNGAQRFYTSFATKARNAWARVRRR